MGLGRVFGSGMLEQLADHPGDSRGRQGPSEGARRKVITDFLTITTRKRRRTLNSQTSNPPTRVAAMYTAGHTTKAIADALGITLNCVHPPGLRWPRTWGLDSASNSRRSGTQPRAWT